MESTGAAQGGGRHWTNYLTRERRIFYVPSWLIFLWFTWVAYLVGYRLSHVNQMNTTYKYTYLEPSYAPGTLTSDRSSPNYIIEIIISVVREVTVLVTFARLLFFRTKWVINFHIFLMFFFLLLEGAAAIMLGLEISECNQVENNPCNSYKWCAVYTLNSTTCPQMFPYPVSPNTTAIPYKATWIENITKDDLTWNLEFSISFFLSLYMTLITTLMWLWSVLGRNPTRVVSETYQVVEGRMHNQSVNIPLNNLNNTTIEYETKFK